MNNFTIKLFATLRERAHTAELTREFPDGTTVGDIWRQLVVEFPELGGHRDSVGFAVNQEYVEGDFKPRKGDEIAFIPPVSGGAQTPAYVGKITIGRNRIDVAALEREVADPAAGAIVSFTGTTRRDNAGRAVIRLEYEAYEPMALSEMRKLAVEAGAPMCWWKYVGRHGDVIGLERFGASSPGPKVMEELGYSPANVSKRAKQLLERVRPAATAGKA